MLKLKTYLTTISGWIVYDVGNNLSYTGVIGLMFPLWLTRTMGGQ
jgi:MFS-type transporter involved in bile tolerance (Atg22 family)